MNSSEVIEIVLDALKDSALVFAFVFITHIILSFIDLKMSNFLVKRKKLAPLYSSIFGLIPQCGTSVLGADLYLKRYITKGTLLALFISCSDEALIILLSSGSPKTIYSIPLVLIKFVSGAIFGILLDLIIRKQEINEVEEVVEEEKCNHHIHEKDNTKIHKHLFHPLKHSLEIFIYVLIINLILGFIIGLIGEDKFTSFMVSSKYLSPLYSSIIGLIPNCASSVLITELFLENSLPFGSLVSGLIVNSGLGMVVLLKDKKNLKDTLIIIGISFVISVVIGYIVCLITGFN